MLDIVTAFPHTGILALALILLINAQFAKSNLSNIAAIGLIIYLGFDQLDPISEQSILHFSLDLMLLAILSFPASRITGSGQRTLYFFVALILMGAIHNLWTDDHHEDKISASPLDPEGELLVQFTDSETLEKWIGAHSNEFDITYPAFEPLDQSFLLDEYLIINIADGVAIKEVRDNLKKETGIAHVEYNEILTLDLPAGMPASPSYSQLTLNDPLATHQWISEKFRLGELHDLLGKQNAASERNPEVLIAILDTGIDAKHEDLADNYYSISRSYDTDPKGHGTHCAGIAAAVTGNGIGIASLLPSGSPIKVTSVKVLNSMGIGSQHSIVNGIIEAADAGANVISISIGGITSDKREKAYTEAVRYANDKGAVVVVAAGNSSMDARGMTPANVKGVISVTAINDQLTRSYFANDVSQLGMGLAAPGEAIFSTKPGNKYKAENGTSMAAPFVGGVIGLIKYYAPEMTTGEIYELLKSTAVRNEDEYIVDPLEALTQILQAS